MKFTSLLSLVAASTAFAYTIPSKRANVDLANLDLTNLLDGATGLTTSDACKKATEEFQECIIGTDQIKKDTLDKVCETYNSQKCQDFYKNGLNGVEACKNDDAFLIQMSNVIVESNQSNVGLFCIKDEANQYCPYGQFILDIASKSETITNAEVEASYNQAVNNVCKSKKCTDAFVEYTDKKNKLTGDIEDLNKKLSKSKRAEFKTTLSDANKTLEETINYLKSTDCTSQQTVATGTAAPNTANATANTSGAVSNKVTGFFVSAALVAAAYLL